MISRRFLKLFPGFGVGYQQFWLWIFTPSTRLFCLFAFKPVQFFAVCLISLYKSVQFFATYFILLYKPVHFSQSRFHSLYNFVHFFTTCFYLVYQLANPPLCYIWPPSTCHHHDLPRLDKRAKASANPRRYFIGHHPSLACSCH